jgi:transcriptional regulator with XRE-family HTH domain
VNNSKDIEISKVRLGELVKNARMEKHKKTGEKYTQQMLASDIGSSRSYIGDIETGRIYPGYKNLTKIAEACEVPLEFFNGVTENIYYNDPNIFPHLPQDLQEFVAKEESTPYLVVAKQLSAYDLTKLTETELKFLVDWLKTAINNNK